MRHLVITDEEKARALYVVKELVKANFSRALYYKGMYEDTSISDWEDENIDVLDALGISIHTGATKACIVDNHNPNWVIKISFNRNTCEYYIKNNLVIDFCKKEVEYYKMAVAESLQKFFAATYFLCEIDEMYITIQESVSVDCGFFTDMFSDKVSKHYSREDFDSEESFNAAIWDEAEEMDNDERIYAVLGEDDDEVDKLVAFVERNDINDLHCGNWGITGDGTCVLMDFSGFVD